ncbi:hypothetical protein ACFL6S_20865 [Candidatus Poribacteria bacterium]
MGRHLSEGAMLCHIGVKLSEEGDEESLFWEKKFLNWEALRSPVRGDISIENVL